MKFRKDINGLRAIGLIAVISFHFNNNLFPGVVAALDIFFVISGFLMSAIIFKGLEHNRFSFIQFYASRALRIVPALFFLCSFMLVFGWFYLIPLDYELLGRHVAGSIGFFSNFTYNNEAGYFDSLANTKWLLHTWSLSLEWQFYLLYPILLMVLYRFFSMRVLKHTILALAIIGYFYGIYATKQDANAAYFMLPSRAWDMMAGSLVFLYPLNLSQKTKKYAEWLSLALIFACYFFINIETNTWPGPWVLIPVIGTVLVMYAQNNDSIITANPIAQALGNWSYSVYLWHWPIVVGIHYFELPDYWLYIGFIMSFVIGYFGYRYIEMGNWKSPYRDIKRLLTFKPLYMMLILIFLGRLTYKTEGFINHYPKSVIIASKEAINRNPYRCGQDRKMPCYIGNKDNIKALMVGDSHADSQATALAANYDLEQEGIIVISHAGCLFVSEPVEYIKKELGCDEYNQEAFTYLKNNYRKKPLFWVAHNAGHLYSDGLEAGTEVDANLSLRVAELKSKLSTTIDGLNDERQVYLVGQTPIVQKDVPRAMSKALFFGDKDIDLSPTKADYDVYAPLVMEVLNQVAQQHNAIVLDPEPYMCNDTHCMASINGHPLFYDTNHLNEYGNKLLVPMFAQVIKS